MKIGITFGAFDLLQTGHLLMLSEAKTHCDYLIVGLQVNPKVERPNKNKPVETMFERYSRLDATVFVDRIVPYETEEDLRGILLMFKPSIRFIGEDWKDKTITAEDLKIPIYWTKRQHEYSSSNLRRRIEKAK
jgi:glycerol-3-phosphate cytidylyltransferase